MILVFLMEWEKDKIIVGMFSKMAAEKHNLKKCKSYNLVLISGENDCIVSQTRCLPTQLI